MVADGGRDDDAENQGAQRIHGQVALEKALEHRRAAITLGTDPNLAGGKKQRGAAKQDQ